MVVSEDQRPGAAAALPVPAGPVQAAGGSPARPGEQPDIAARLRDVQLITDAALSALDPQALLDALVKRIKEALQADTAAILLLDQPSGQLVATAASGLEEEVRQGVRIPLGKGFAGRIAAERRPVILTEVDRTNGGQPDPPGQRHPVAHRSAAAGRLGRDSASCTWARMSHRAFTEDDLNLLQLAADRAALAVQSINAQLDTAATAVLQRSLLPSALPAVRGLGLRAPATSLAAVMSGATGTTCSRCQGATSVP